MTSSLREFLDESRAAYGAARYPGDLAAELLPARVSRRLWVIPALIGSLAAVVTLAVWLHVPAKSGGVAVNPGRVENAAGPRLMAVADIKYAMHLRAVDTNVRQAVHVLRGGVDKALHAPLVIESVEKVDEVTEDLKQIASTTWSQFRVTPKGPC